MIASVGWPAMMRPTTCSCTPRKPGKPKISWSRVGMAGRMADGSNGSTGGGPALGFQQASPAGLVARDAGREQRHRRADRSRFGQVLQPYGPHARLLIPLAAFQGAALDITAGAGDAGAESRADLRPGAQHAP